MRAVLPLQRKIDNHILLVGFLLLALKIYASGALRDPSLDLPNKLKVMKEYRNHLESQYQDIAESCAWSASHVASACCLFIVLAGRTDASCGPASSLSSISGCSSKGQTRSCKATLPFLLQGMRPARDCM